MPNTAISTATSHRRWKRSKEHAVLKVAGRLDKVSDANLVRSVIFPLWSQVVCVSAFCTHLVDAQLGHLGSLCVSKSWLKRILQRTIRRLQRLHKINDERVVNYDDTAQTLLPKRTAYCERQWEITFQCDTELGFGHPTFFAFASCTVRFPNPRHCFGRDSRSLVVDDQKTWMLLDSALFDEKSASAWLSRTTSVTQPADIAIFQEYFGQTLLLRADGSLVF